MIALIDESLALRPNGYQYVIASAIVVSAPSIDHVDIESLREAVRQLVAARSRPFRWKHEGVIKKGEMIDLIVNEQLFVTASISKPRKAHHDRLSRAECLTNVCAQLAIEGIEELVIESRGVQDTDDISTIQAAKKSGSLPESFPEPDFRGKSEPLLWIPDAVAGAIREAETAKNRTWLERLTGPSLVIDINRP